MSKRASNLPVAKRQHGPTERGGRVYSYKPGHRWRNLFMEFIGYLTIDSKETGVGPLVLYGSQMRFLDEVCEGLDRGVRHFVCLKARQLGISTVSLAMDLFWILVHDGLQGCLITDTDENRKKFRILIERYLDSLPLQLRSGIVKHNATNLVLKNGSVLDYVVAGGRKVGGGGLGRSRAWNFVHATECSGWGSEAGYASMIAALAQKHPDRLYIFESTARGYNLFWDIWSEALADTLTQKAFFIGWWSNENYSFRQTSREFKAYWDGKPDDGERALMDKVWKQHAARIMPEQLAWHRWMRTAKISSDDLMAQEYPWTAEEAFVMTGKNFFPSNRINDDIKWVLETKLLFKAFAYHMGENFLATTVEPVERASLADLRVWEEPHPDGFYVAGVDPAYGRADYKDNHCIEVFRCYADCIVQVAEYASVNPETYQLAWVLAHLAGVYKNIWINLEVNGPGPAVMRELKHLRELMDRGQLAQAAADRKLENVLGNVRYYLYHRPDSLGAGYAYGWKTTQDNKLLILNQMRDAYALRALRLRSVPLLEEMQRTIQDGSLIEAEGRGHDDRVFATALANKAYIEWLRSTLIANNMTYENVSKHERAVAQNPNTTLIDSLVQDFFKQKEEQRVEEKYAAAWR
jgi:hypothetical protein